MSRIPHLAFLTAFAAAVPSALAQIPAPAPAQTAKAPARPQPPTRDPHTPGYVTAKELPDGTLPPANADGNFIIGLDAQSCARDDRERRTCRMAPVYHLHHELRR